LLPFGSLWAPFWLAFGVLWLTFGARGLTFAHLGARFSHFWGLLTSFLILFDIFDEKSIVKSSFLDCKVQPFFLSERDTFSKAPEDNTRHPDLRKRNLAEGNLDFCTDHRLLTPETDPNSAPWVRKGRLMNPKARPSRPTWCHVDPLMHDHLPRTRREPICRPT